MNRTAMILAAGLGMRMRPLTNTCPKPLLVVAGKTMLERCFDHVKDAQISKIVVNSHYLAPLIEQAVRALIPAAQISYEEERLETGGGVKKALPLLGKKPFFVLNGDSVWTGSESLYAMNSIWMDDKMDALLLLVPREKAFGYGGKGDFFLKEDGSLTRRGHASSAPFVYSGIQLLNPRLFQKAPSGPFSINLMWDQALQEKRLYGLMHQGDWFHIGTPEDLKTYDPLIREKESTQF